MTSNSRSSSFDSIYSEESSSGVNLNDAIVMSVSEDMLSNSMDEHFFTFSIRRDSDRDLDVTKNTTQTGNRSSMFELSDNTTFMSLPPINRLHHENNKFTSNRIQNSINVHNSREENRERNKRVPLSEQLKRIFEEILEKHAIPTTKSNISNPNKSGNSLLDKINLRIEMLNQIEIDNSDSVDKLNTVHAEANDRLVMEPMRSLQSKLHHKSVFFLNNDFPRELVTILENSYESSSNSQLESSSEWTARCIGRLRIDALEIQKN